LTSFHDFGLAEPITRALAQDNYSTPTPIQRDAIPTVLSGRDLIGIAQTGTGKTAAFALPILQRLLDHPRPLEKKSCRVLVLSPTRELSSQILDSFRAYGRHLRLTSTLAIGGVPMGKQVRALMHGVDVLVATPGRLLDLVRGNALRLGTVDVVVLDEADRMLDMGFIHDIRAIVAKLPKQRQTLLFSATMPREIAELAGDMLTEPARVSVTPVSSTAERIAQRVIHTDRAAKPDLLVDVLRKEPIERALVFTRTKHGADKVVKSLAKAGIAAEAIHGNKSQNQRERVMANFRAGRVLTLVATDIAARGIDVDGISHVVNYDLPNIPESYVHRIGRTARAGAEGVAISFCDAEEAPFLRDIEKLIRMAIPATGERPRAASRPAGGRPPRHGAGADGNRSPGKPSRSRGNPSRDNSSRGDAPATKTGDQPSRAARGDQRRHSGQPSGKGQDGSIGSVGFMQQRGSSARGQEGDAASAAAPVYGQPQRPHSRPQRNPRRHGRFDRQTAAHSAEKVL
jgi:ATP-dependent RNA helicase RhlE